MLNSCPFVFWNTWFFASIGRNLYHVISPSQSLRYSALLGALKSLTLPWHQSLPVSYPVLIPFVSRSSKMVGDTETKRMIDIVKNCVRKEYMKISNPVQTNDWYWIELLVFDRNTWNSIIVCKQMSYNYLFRNKFTNKVFTNKTLYIYIHINRWSGTSCKYTCLRRIPTA